MCECVYCVRRKQPILQLRCHCTHIPVSSQIVAALFSNSSLVLELLSKTTFPSSGDSVITQFITSWFQECQKFEGYDLLLELLYSL